MADTLANADLNHPKLNLTADEKRLFGALFSQADPEGLGVVTGEAAVKFFDKTKLDAIALSQIWQIADEENRGLLTLQGFCKALRLIGYVQTGREPTPELANRPGPLPKFEGFNLPPTAVPSNLPPPPGPPPQQTAGGPIRIPTLTPDKAAEYTALFEKSGAQSGILSGEIAKHHFEKAKLPNDVLGRIWNLADTEQRGALGVTEFIIAMHLLACYKSRQLTALPTTLPAPLYEAAARRPVAPPPPRPPTGAGPSAIPRQFSGPGNQRNQSPATRPPYGTPPQSAQPTGGDWLITPNEKASYDGLFDKVDNTGRGYITGEQAVPFFTESGLSEDVLAQIWDLSDIRSTGQLGRDEFAVAMYLIRSQRGKSAPALPRALPPTLVPPSMRQVQPASQSTAPIFDPNAYSSTVAKSASEDLFGLDAFTSPPPNPLPEQTTGGSGSFSGGFGTDPFGSKATSPTTAQQPFQPAQQRAQQGSSFKPFTPMSAFGQGLQTQNTGTSATSSSGAARGPQQPSAMDDLLGDNDPEISKKLTKETSELANMSNQIGTLRTQMQEVQSKKMATENDLKSTNTQKRDLELRLSQFRSQYEQEAKAVKDLEGRLSSSRADTRRLQQEFQVLQTQYQSIQGQHAQMAAALDADQRENANLKARISQMDTELRQLRPQLDKMRADSKQQKGLLAIHKKQLAGSETERDKVRGEMGDMSKDVERSAQQSQTGSGVASPAASVTSQSTNPFFRKSPQPSFDNSMSPSGFARGSTQAPDKFESIFGTYSPAASTPPVTSFGGSHAPTFSTQSGPSVRSSEPDVPTPSTSPPLSSSGYHENQRGVEPPPPPTSRQITGQDLPLPGAIPRNESFSSSVRVATPGSRYGATGAETPTAGSPAGAQSQESSRGIERTETNRTEKQSFGQALFDRNNTASPTTASTSDTRGSGGQGDDSGDMYQNFGAPSVPTDMPGAFPSVEPTAKAEPIGETNKVSGNARSDPFSASGGQPRMPTAAKVDFDEAFASFGSGSRQNTGTSPTGPVEGPNMSRVNKEFPPLEEIGGDDSDSASEPGFDDNFTTASPGHHRQASHHRQGSHQSRPTTSNTNESAGDFFSQRPPLSTKSTDLPGPNAQKSPPTYDQTIPRSGSNQFPPEFGGLLPSRQDPTSPPQSQGSQSPEKTFAQPSSQGHALFGGGPSGSSKATSSAPTATFSSASPPTADTPSSTVPSDAYHSAVSYPSGSTDKSTTAPAPQSFQLGRNSFGDDFDSGFDDLAEAKEADDKADDDFMLSSHHTQGFEEFNPVFESPAASKSNTMQSQQTPRQGQVDDSFGDFEHLSQSFATQSSGSKLAQPTASSSTDWDTLFKNMENPKEQEKAGVAAAQGESGKGSQIFPPAPSAPSGSKDVNGSTATAQQDMPSLARALSSGTEHDDPILKRLTAMGYPRSDALSALEKFDYDVDLAADYLTSPTR